MNSVNISWMWNYWSVFNFITNLTDKSKFTSFNYHFSVSGCCCCVHVPLQSNKTPSKPVCMWLLNFIETAETKRGLFVCFRRSAVLALRYLLFPVTVNLYNTYFHFCASGMCHSLNDKTAEKGRGDVSVQMAQKQEETGL